MHITAKRPGNPSGCPVSTLRILSFWACLFVAIFYSHAAYSADEVHRYREVTGASVKNVTWQLHRRDRLVLFYSSPTEQHVTTTGASYNTTRWEAADSENKTDLVAARSGNTIIVYGRFRGETVSKTLKIDTCPWFQATSLSLRELVVSSDSQRKFWTIRLDTLTAHKLKAVKQEVETIALDGIRKPLLRIRLRPTGLLAPFWKSDYWFTLPEGLFFRFEGPSGPPGSPITVVTLADR